MDRESTPTLSLRNLSMVFPGQRALSRVALDLRAGEIHALVGQNGSGKSTLIKILAGYHSPAPGSQAWFEGQPFVLGSASAAHCAGLRFIHQDLGLVGPLDCVDNLALGGSYSTRWWVNLRRERKWARAMLRKYGLDIDVATPVERLTSAERTILAIVRALETRNGGSAPKVLVLDEPSEALARREVTRLFDMLRAVAAGGTAVLYVSHRLDEVLEIADVATVLRDGAVVTTVPTADLDRDALVELIVGRRVDPVVASPAESEVRTVMRIRELSGGSVEPVSFDLHEGEILGIAGLAGSGREELPALIAGARPWSGGVIEIGNMIRTTLSPRAARAAGIVFVASDRARLSAIPSHTARENITLPRLRGSGRLRWLSARREHAEVIPWMRKTQVEPCEPERIFSTFSGGNQQKIVLARALRLKPRILVIDEPVQGVDVAARVAILQQMIHVADTGVPVLIASSDEEELANVCTRVLVLSSGRIVAQLVNDFLTAERIIDASIATRASAVPVRA
jgi:ribose transport system ATP-binding protein